MNTIIRELTLCVGMSLSLAGCFSNTPEVTSLRSGSAEADKSARDAKDALKKSANQQKNKTCLQLVGGTPTNAHPEVGFIYTGDDNTGETCSGTFLSDTTMITASHCLQDTATGGARYISGDVVDLSGDKFSATVNSGIPAIKAFIGAPSLTIGKPELADRLQDREKDIAILVFPSGTFKNKAKILNKPLVANKELTLVGYGRITAPGYSEDTPGESIKIKRVGTNRLAQMDSKLRAEFNPDSYIIAGNASSDGKTESAQAVLGHGDSGGPLFLGQELAAIASSGNVNSDSVKPFVNNAESLSFFASLQSTFARQFLANAIAGGAVITFADDALKSSEQSLNIDCSP
ncbi:MAG: trypsin-like serine protease [Proteobacteria bacterium]|nr:trypsin-like serine protease [Pseudomonadota bacterium]